MCGLDCHAKQGGNESCLRQRVVLSDSPHSSLADQMHCFHTPDRSPCAVERAVTFRQPYPLFDRSYLQSSLVPGGSDPLFPYPGSFSMRCGTSRNLSPTIPAF